MTTPVHPPEILQDRLLTITRELPADLDTPVSVYLRLMGRGASFLLESVTGGEQVARFSFIGVDASEIYILEGHRLETRRNTGEISVEQLPDHRDPLDALRSIIEPFLRSPVPDLPRFAGGLVGYIGYEMMRFIEPSIGLDAHDRYPDAIFMHADTVVAFDHAFGKMILIANSLVPEDRSADLSAIRLELNARLDQIQSRLEQPLNLEMPAAAPSAGTELRSNMTESEFSQAVDIAKEHIAAGDIFQVVLSQRLERVTSAEPIHIYRTLRRLNPSPYMIFLDFGAPIDGQPFQIIGASPEMHVRLEDGTASLRPIAGTRPRGKTPLEDQELETELLADPKELAEHVMLVDLARNDLGRVCEFGSVEVSEQMVVERYSHVMHIVSHTTGQLRAEFDAFDLLRATFPAGTVSGAPKIRAMQIIDELEADARGPYAGAVGYIGYDGNSDTCIAIRTLTVVGDTVSVQAGAGIVADSVPETEYQETLHKAQALAEAITLAEQIGQTQSSSDQTMEVNGNAAGH
jgi:anthranilate synthase component 1